MARTVNGRKSAAKKVAAKKAAPKAKAKAVTKKAAPPAPARRAGLKKVAARVKAAVKKAGPKKAAVKQAAPKKAIAAKKAPARGPAKKTVARIPAARRPPIRRARVAAAPRPKVPAARLKTVAPAQRFSVNHLNEADFKPDGLRSYALYRDLAVADASGGLCRAHVIRLLSPCTDEVRVRHIHEPELQLIYVLKGWVKNEFEGHGVQMMSAGSCFLQPPGIRHTVLDYSADVELLEIIVPADFKTEDVD